MSESRGVQHSCDMVCDGRILATLYEVFPEVPSAGDIFIHTYVYVYTHLCMYVDTESWDWEEYAWGKNGDKGGTNPGTLVPRLVGAGSPPPCQACMFWCSLCPTSAHRRRSHSLAARLNFFSSCKVMSSSTWNSLCK